MPGENIFRLGVRLMVLTAVIAGGFVSAALASAVTKDGVVESDKTNHEVEPYYNGHGIFKKQGPYIYGQDVSYHNVTFTPATLTITLKTTSVTTETVVPQVAIVNSTTGTVYRPSVTGFTPKPTAIIHVTPFNTIHAHTVTGSLNDTLTSTTVDAQTNSVASTNDIRSSAIASNVTVDSVFKCTHTPTLTKQSSTFQVSEFTTTILYSVSDGEEYTSTETVTVTPHVTIMRGTTITLPPDAKTTTIDSTVTQTHSSLGVVTVTVYVSEVLTEAQTGAVGISVSAYHITDPKPVTTTVVQTVYPVPTSISTTTCTESDMTKTQSVSSASHSPITVAGILPTVTVTVNVESLSSSTDASILTETSTATTTVTSGVAAASASVDTTCTTSTAATAGNPTATAVTSSSASHTRHQMSDSSYSSIGLINSTVGTVVVSSAHVTAQSITRYTALTHIPSANFTGSAITTYPVSSGAGPDEKPPCSVPWGGNDGGGSRSCVVMLAVVISLGLQAFVM